jgi:hypothetical protein
VTGVRRAVVMAIVGILCWGSLLWVMGLDVGHAIVLAAALVALISLRHAPAINADENWPDQGDARSDVGARREVARLSWSMQGYESRVQRHSVRRLHEIAVFRLDGQGLDLDDPRDYLACQAALGERAYRVVSEPENRPLYADFVAAVGVVERLGARSTSIAGSVGSGPERGDVR